MKRNDDFERIAEEMLNDDEAAELASARRRPTKKRELSEAELRQKQSAGLSFAMKLSPADKRAIGERLTEARAAAAKKRREALEAAGTPIKERPSRRRGPAQSALEPFMQQVLDRWPDAELSPLELRREAILLYKVARLTSTED